jgi:hypothetical protein
MVVARLVVVVVTHRSLPRLPRVDLGAGSILSRSQKTTRKSKTKRAARLATASLSCLPLIRSRTVAIAAMVDAAVEVLLVVPAPAKIATLLPRLGPLGATNPTKMRMRTRMKTKGSSL